MDVTKKQVACAIAVVIASACNSLSSGSTGPVQGEVPTEQMTMIRLVVDAVNRRDRGAFVMSFSPEGEFNPRGNLKRTLFSNSQPVADEELVDVWMGIIDAWGLEAELDTCREDGRGGFAGGRLVRCEVATRWHTLSIEILEEWTFEFSGRQLAFWGHRLVDLEPAQRTLSFGYDLIEEWEAWLESTDPVAASLYLNQRLWDDSCDGCREHQDSLAPGNPELAARLAPLVYGSEKAWMVNRHSWHPDGLIPYDPNLASEIAASIQAYLSSQ